MIWQLFASTTTTTTDSSYFLSCFFLFPSSSIFSITYRFLVGIGEWCTRVHIYAVASLCLLFLFFFGLCSWWMLLLTNGWHMPSVTYHHIIRCVIYSNRTDRQQINKMFFCSFFSFFSDLGSRRCGRAVAFQIRSYSHILTNSWLNYSGFVSRFK